MEKALVEERVGLVQIRINPGIMSARSGIKQAAIKNAELNRKKNSVRKDRSDSCFSRFNIRTSVVTI
jgi:hypothetical protein